MARTAKHSPKLKVKKPESVFNKPLKADFKELFKALFQRHRPWCCWQMGKTWHRRCGGSICTGLVTEPGELAFLLIRRSMIMTVFELAGESASLPLADPKEGSDAIIEQLDFSVSSNEFHIDHRFFDRPAELPLIGGAQALLEQWFEACGI